MMHPADDPAIEDAPNYANWDGEQLRSEFDAAGASGAGWTLRVRG